MKHNDVDSKLKKVKLLFLVVQIWNHSKQEKLIQRVFNKWSVHWWTVKNMLHPWLNLHCPCLRFLREWYSQHHRRECDRDAGPACGVTVYNNCLVPCTYDQLDPKWSACRQQFVQHHQCGWRRFLQLLQHSAVPGSNRHHRGVFGNCTDTEKSTNQLCLLSCW